MTNKKGFTLIETLLAILVLTVSITGPLTIASRGLNAALMAKNKTTAFYLAQDAMEFVRYKRDTNRLTYPSDTTKWLDGLDDTLTQGCVSSTGVSQCRVDSISGEVVKINTTPPPVLNFDSATNVYSYTAVGGTNQPSMFTRTVSIKTPVAPNSSLVEAQVVVDVTWYDISSTTRTVRVRENMLNWQ